VTSHDLSWNHLGHVPRDRGTQHSLNLVRHMTQITLQALLGVIDGPERRHMLKYQSDCVPYPSCCYDE